ncbi:MAG: hypothetical protein KTR24_00695 [Saprospiraceae bacterium]|nr:hypothetical protein [Saprospiraceae bacterium]
MSKKSKSKKKKKKLEELRNKKKSKLAKAKAKAKKAKKAKKARKDKKGKKKSRKKAAHLKASKPVAKPKKKKSKSKEQKSKATAASTVAAAETKAALPKTGSVGSEDTSLRQKIRDLFSYRQIPWMLEISSIVDHGEFTDKLMALQEKIYDLDHYLETNWKLTDRGLRTHWTAMRKALAAFGVPQNKMAEMLRQIERYQSHEVSLRTEKSPTRFSMRHLYYYKSCDVRLMRALIYQADPLLAKILRPADWNEFDLITEVNDDIADLQEDTALLNGNRLLFDVHEQGKAHANKSFRSFIREIELKNAARFRDRKSSEARHLKQCTTAAIRDTRALLTTALKGISAADVATAKIIEARTGE